MNILKAADKALKDKVFFESQIYISADVSKSVRNDRAKLRKDYLNEIKEKEDVEFAFIPWSVPAQILYKKVSTAKRSSFKLPTGHLANYKQINCSNMPITIINY